MRSLKKPLLLLVLAGLPACLEQNVTLTIAPDGQCTLAIEMIAARSLIEKQMLMRQASIAEEAEEEGKAEAKKSLTDEELVAAVKEGFSANVFPGAKPKLEAVEVKDDKVRIAFSVVCPTVKEMVGKLEGPWEQFGLTHKVVSRDEQGNLQLAFSRPEEYEPGRRDPLKTMKAAGYKGSAKFVFPGKVVKSPLPKTEGNATWLTIDPGDAASYDAFEKLLEAPIAITFEPGGLALDGLPLDSEELADVRGGREEEPEGPQLPITDAGPGFLAEATSVTSTAHYVFPEGEKLLKALRRVEEAAEGVVVRAKLYPPRGRRFLRLEQCRALKAVDDKGRSLPVPKGNGPGENYYSPGDEASTAVQTEIRLPLPEPDAADPLGPTAIERLDGEAIVTTFAKWKTHDITPVKADPQAAIDLGDVVDGAKMAVTKATRKTEEGGGKYRQHQGQIDLKVTGPPDIRQLGFEVKIPGDESPSSHIREDSYRGGEKEGTRSVSIMYYIHTQRAELDWARLTLIVRYPDGLRRERVKFTLEALDLF